MFKGAALALASLLLVSPVQVRPAPTSPLQGAWQVVDVGGQPMAGLYIYTATHYSMMWAASDRPQIDDTSKATADELRAMWGPLAGNAGTYDVSSNLVTIHPVVAKIPIVMAPGANEVYAFKIDGDILSLTQQRNSRGVLVQNGTTTRLRRVE